MIDASALGALAAIRDMKFPKFDGEKVDYKEITSKRLEVTKKPIAVTVIKIGEKFIVDPDSDEEKAIDARLTVTTMEDGTLCALQKGGNYPVSTDDIMKMVDIGAEKGKEMRVVL